MVDWTKGHRPWTFFEEGVVGHVGMAEPFDGELRRVVERAIAAEGVLRGNVAPKVHEGSTVICIGEWIASFFHSITGQRVG